MSKRKADKSPLPTEDEEETTPATTRRTSRAKHRSDRPRPSYKEDSEEEESVPLEDESKSDENEEENNGDGKEEEETVQQPSGPSSRVLEVQVARPLLAASAADDEGKHPHEKNNADGLECEFCHRSFKNLYGYKYHVENDVCRRGSVKNTQRGTRKKSEASGKSFPKVRGKQEDRICPHCNKKFTSPLGCQYHVSKSLFTVSMGDRWEGLLLPC